MRSTLLGGLVAVGLLTGGTAWAQDWLSLCSKCIAPSVFSKTGIGTANAVAMARVTEADAKSYCDSWQPDDRTCVRQQMATDEAKQTYRASANCPAGRITAIDGKTYRLDGVWGGGDVGAGRSRWRASAGRVVGRDNASGGLGISQQWEVLCPKTTSATARPAPPPRASTPAVQSGAAFQVGQSIEAIYERSWVRGKIISIRQNTTARGTETQYEIVLDNRKRGIVPARMLRPANG